MFNFWHQIRTLVWLKYSEFQLNNLAELMAIHSYMKNEFGNSYTMAILKIVLVIISCSLLIALIAL